MNDRNRNGCGGFAHGCGGSVNGCGGYINGCGGYGSKDARASGNPPTAVPTSAIQRAWQQARAVLA